MHFIIFRLASKIGLKEDVWMQMFLIKSFIYFTYNTLYVIHTHVLLFNLHFTIYQ